MPDKASGDLRFFTVLRILAAPHHVVYFAANTGTEEMRRGSPPAARYRGALEALGVDVYENDIIPALKANVYDVVLFEFHYMAATFQRLCRRYQPAAKMIVDSVDVHFKRLEARARLTDKASDAETARRVKASELRAYELADAVIAVSAEERSLLTKALPGLKVEVVPNIHPVPPAAPQTHRAAGAIVFVGGFRHDPNIDAMLFFCQQVFPSIRRAVPNCRLQIIGSYPPAEIAALAGPGVEVLGYVPRTAPYLDAAEVFVAPLRYGGGMKGKVGEAMSHGLPVVTTSFGAEGFGVTPGTHLLVADDPVGFAAHVINLLGDAALRQRIGEAAREFIRAHYSEDTLGKKVLLVFERLSALPGRKFSAVRRLASAVLVFFQTRLLWRLKT